LLDNLSKFRLSRVAAVVAEHRLRLRLHAIAHANCPAPTTTVPSDTAFVPSSSFRPMTRLPLGLTVYQNPCS
jgi:hypothetical protein